MDLNALQKPRERPAIPRRLRAWALIPAWARVRASLEYFLPAESDDERYAGYAGPVRYLRILRIGAGVAVLGRYGENFDRDLVFFPLCLANPLYG